MTERFTLIKNTGTDEYYSDNLYDNGTYIGTIHNGSEMILYLLNDLFNKNKQLKKEIAQLTIEVEALKQIKPSKKLPKNLTK